MDAENPTLRKPSRRRLGQVPEFSSLPSPTRQRRDVVGRARQQSLPSQVNKLFVDENKYDDDASVTSKKSRKSKTSFYSTAPSQRSEAIRLKMQAEIDSMERMNKLHEEAEHKRLAREAELEKKRLEKEAELEKRQLERKAEIEKRRLEMEKLCIDNAGNDSDGDDPAELCPVEIEPDPAAAIEKVKSWQENQPACESRAGLGENNYLQEQLVLTNHRLERMLSWQTVNNELPFFGGNPEEWPMFLRQYERTTQVCGLSDDENMLRLNKALKGKAREAVLPVLGIPENVSAVMQTLGMMFGRPDQVIETMVANVRATPVPKEGKPESLISFANQISNLVANMQMLRKTGHLANPTLLNELVTKLPYQLRYQWCAWVMCLQRDATLADLADWMRTVAMTVSLMHTECNIETNNVNKNKKTVLAAVENEKSTCLYCDKAGHVLKDCRKFVNMKIQAKWQIVKEKSICFSCLLAGHRSSDCTTKDKCGMDGCDRLHHKLLHKPKPEGDQIGKKKEVTENPSNKVEAEKCGHVVLMQGMKEVLLRVISVKLSSNMGEVNTFALLDEGSSVTMLSDAVAKKLQISGPVDPLCIQWTNGITNEESTSERVSLKIAGAGEAAKQFTLFNVRTVSKMNLPSQTINMEILREKWPYLKDIPFNSMEDAQPQILIGSDNILVTTPRKIRQGLWNDQVTTKTWLGWVVHGNVIHGDTTESRSYAFHICESAAQDVNLDKLVRDSFSTEAFGVKVVEKPLRSKEDERALWIMEKTTKNIGNRYETGLLWRTDKFHLPESKSGALRRLHCMERKMEKDPLFAQEYCRKIEDYIAKGYCRKMSREEAAVVGPKTNYIPHFAVYNPNKPGKLRLVMDAAAKNHGASLNDFLLKGPDLLNRLPAVLMRFREHLVAIFGDLKEMFHQIKIIKMDRDSQRFLWRGKERDQDPDVYVMTSMIFGAASSPSSAMFVKNLMARENQEEFPELDMAVLEAMYMDDLLHGGRNEQEASRKLARFIELFKRGGFEICNWASNSSMVMELIPTNLRAKGFMELNGDSSNVVERVLGLRWSAEEDAFLFELIFHKVSDEVLMGARIPSKREVLRLVMSIFDPLGFLAHYVIRAKILFQQIWLSKIGWDDQLTTHQNEQWQIWLKEMRNIRDVRIPRCYSANLEIAQSVELHTFVDASQEAMAAVSYLLLNIGNNVEIAFVLGRTRVAPTKPLSVPRLELQAALMGARIAVTISEEIKIKIGASYFWSDSRTVVCWIRSETRNYKQFVAHRIGEILDTTNVKDLHWVPTLENPADDGTRSNTETDLSSTCRWLNGPSFLKLGKAEWPTEPSMVEIVLPEEEMKKPVVCLVKIAEKFHFPKIERISSWLKTVRTTAWCCRFLDNFKNKIRGLPLVRGELSVEEIERAERHWWRAVQRECFPEEISFLSKKEPISKSSKLLNLNPFLDNVGVMRLGGRTERASDLDNNAKYPVILDPSHRFTALLMKHYHEQGGHHGLETVICSLRLKYSVKKVFHDCKRCKILKAEPCPPLMGILPEERVQRQISAFAVSGVDYFGPVMVTEGRKRIKRYGVLFTCLATRAVHLEIAKDLSADTTIMAIRRFVCRRGPVKRLFSDNGTNLRGADAELRRSIEELDSGEMRSQLASRGIDWRFIPPGSPHMGGSWERMVKSIIITLAASLKEDAPHEDTLHTLLIEAENLVNSRPLTHISVDPDDPICLTPNHFLRLGQMEGPLGKFTDDDLHLRRQWRRVQRYADHFWTRWVREYLPTLTRRSKWCQEGRQVEVGDIVVVADNNAPRNTWPLGRVVKIYPGKDGRVRVVDVRTQHGTYTRPVTKICILDVKRDADSELSTSGGRNVAA